MFLVTFVVTVGVGIQHGMPQTENQIGYTGTLTIWAFLPLLAFILNFIAKFLIKKDDNLLKSVDRIR